jgi:hypothetical protein
METEEEFKEEKEADEEANRVEHEEESLEDDNYEN